MVDDVLVNKAASIERAVARVREEHGGDDANLLANQTRQDAIILNLQRACESSIGAAMHLVRLRRLGVPQASREAFDLLERAQRISPELSAQMKKKEDGRLPERRRPRLPAAESRDRSQHRRRVPGRLPRVHAGVAPS